MPLSAVNHGEVMGGTRGGGGSLVSQRKSFSHLSKEGSEELEES